MIENLFYISVFALGVCSFASILSGIAWMRYEDEQSRLDARWPTDGIEYQPKLGD